jgi:hypothetical protein
MNFNSIRWSTFVSISILGTLENIMRLNLALPKGILIAESPHLALIEHFIEEPCHRPQQKARL